MKRNDGTPLRYYSQVQIFITNGGTFYAYTNDDVR